MVNKYSLVRKRLIQEGIILFCVVALVTGMGFILDSYDESAQTEQKTKEGEVAGTRQKVAEINKEMFLTTDLVALYNDYIKNHNQNFNLDREVATKWIVEQREKFHLVNLSLTIPPFADGSKDIFTLKSGTMIKSDVKLSFGSLSDNSVFAFIEALQKEMPGIVAIQEIKINRTGDITNSLINGLGQHHLTPIITTDLSFSWIGLRTKEEAKETPNAK